MPRLQKAEVVVVGSGPNGLAAAIALAQAGRSVRVLEGGETLGGGARSAELTLPGFLSDICSAVHPIGAASPFFRSLPLAKHGLEWIEPPLALAHPFDDGTAAILTRSIDETADSLGPDAEAYRLLVGPLVADADLLAKEILAPLHVPRHPFALAKFGLRALRSAAGLSEARFEGEKARTFFAGMSAHSMLRLNQLTTAAFGLVLAVFGHAVGWPVARGGSQAIAEALAAELRALGGEIETGVPVATLAPFAASAAVLLDVTPKQVLKIAGDELPQRYRRKLARYRYGPGVFKVDWALDGPVPWTAAACRRAGTVHLGGSYEEIARSEIDLHAGRRPERPFVILAQQSLFDPSRVPAGKQALWGYCHVPHGSDVDMTEAIENQIERFAPGFRDLILAKSVRSPAAMEQHNPNYVGGDINGGLQDIGQLFTRPVPRLDPYATPNNRLTICSSSTPPGGGVHGMCGFHAAKSALRRME
jgi:phytoene dehydrogenase-like protein